METSDNNEENERSYMEMSDSKDLEETDDDFGFENEENNNYENDSISDSQNESEFDNADNVNFNTDNEEAAFNNIYEVFNRNKMSFNKIKKILGSIVGIEPKIYDMYVNSCCAFVGVLENERKCKFCKEDRYYSNGKSRKNLPFISIIERLKLQFKNSKRSEELLYRYNYTNNIGNLVHGDIGDIFDGQIYKELLDDGYFPDSRDIAFTASCDSYQIFRQKTDDCWVFLFINNNLPQELRVKKENLMVTLIISGPKQPQDFNSFLYPLIQEMKMLQEVKGKSILFELSSLKFPRSFSVDIIHLFFENIAPHIWIEKFYPKNDERNSNNYTISSKTWVKIGEIIEKNRSNMPSDIGRPSHNIVKHSAGFKAVKWAN
ncbi:transposase domain-containing protein [Rhizophagus clarus]|uniref:Transposase domain-containing protein n=1 Tax=Rhizophagus clarus TaxID=94130 RepID=A0A8H3KYP2_9GLOM|nr:transposase domain-containing protein [Rhizophagus clarus]